MGRRRLVGEYWARSTVVAIPAAGIDCVIHTRTRAHAHTRTREHNHAITQTHAYLQKLYLGGEMHGHERRIYILECSRHRFEHVPPASGIVASRSPCLI